MFVSKLFFKPFFNIKSKQIVSVHDLDMLKKVPKIGIDKYINQAAAFNVNISLLAGIFIFTVSVTIGGISFLPAGMGVEDISLVALMVLFNVPGVLALASLIIFRFLNTLMVILVGYAMMG